MLQPLIPSTRRSRRSRPLYARQGMHGSVDDAISALKSGASSLAKNSVRRVVLRSNLSPDIVLDPREASGSVKRKGAFSEALLAFAKPEIELDTVAGRIRVAPWGPPTTNLFWPLTIIGVAGVSALAILAVKGMRA